jgi:hypothetical protein
MKLAILGGLVASLSSPLPAQVLQNGVPPMNSQSQDVMAKVDQLALSQTAAYTRTLDASGNDTIDFSPVFNSPPRVAYFPQNPDTTGKPIVCNYQTLTATRLTYHCDKSPGALTSLLGPLFNMTGAAGATIQIIVRGTMVTPP